MGSERVIDLHKFFRLCRDFNKTVSLPFLYVIAFFYVKNIHFANYTTIKNVIYVQKIIKIVYIFTNNKLRTVHEHFYFLYLSCFSIFFYLLYFKILKSIEIL